MRTTMLACALAAAALMSSTAPSAAQYLYNGFLRIDPMGVDRPPGPVPNSRRGSRRVYEPIRGNFPACKGFLWVGTRCRLPTGQVCMIYKHGLDSCI
ncbi:MAG TPA: hypothetical protein VNZ50_19200 [Hyphomicrobiaceae bacterium]|nr:hypothetical protein [Hyphomicrobiaceae bacterium]